MVRDSCEECAENGGSCSQIFKFMRLNASLNTQKLKMVGFSVGAHIVSLAARVLKQSDSPVAEVIGKWKQKISSLKNTNITVNSSRHKWLCLS